MFREPERERMRGRDCCIWHRKVANVTERENDGYRGAVHTCWSAQTVKTHWEVRHHLKTAAGSLQERVAGMWGYMHQWFGINGCTAAVSWTENRKQMWTFFFSFLQCQIKMRKFHQLRTRINQPANDWEMGLIEDVFTRQVDRPANLFLPFSQWLW